MRIESLYIDGYGVFQNFRLGPLGQLTVILGPNESGKTTLLSFIRTILFGFLDARIKENRYPAVRGGRHGGSLVLRDSGNQSYTIERIAGPRGGNVVITRPDGSLGDHATLDLLLGNASRDLFRNVFAFSLSELQTFDTLSGEELRGRIYSAGIGAGRQSVTEVDRILTRQQADLFRARGSTQTVNRLFQQIEEIERRLNELKGQASGYDGLHGELDRLRQHIESTRENYHRQQGLLRHVQNLLQAWDDWIDLKGAEERLQVLTPVLSFPPAGVARLERSLERRRLTVENLRSSENVLVRQRTELEGIKINQPVLEERPTIERLRRDLSRYESAKKDLPQRETELRLQSNDFEESLRNLGPDWDEDRLRGFDSSIPTREAIRGYRDALFKAAQSLHDADRELDLADQQLGEDKTHEERLQQELNLLEEPAEKDVSVVEKRRRRLRILRDSVVYTDQKQQRKNDLLERETEFKDRRAGLERQLTASESYAPLWPVIPILLAAFGMGIWLALEGQFTIAGVVTIFLVIAAGAYSYLRQRLVGAGVRRLDLVKEDVGSVKGLLESVQIELRTIASQLEQEMEQVHALAQELGLEQPVTLRGVQQLESGIDASAGEAAAWQSMWDKVREQRILIEKAALRLTKAKGKHDQALSAVEESGDEWRSWLRRGGMAETLTPDGCLELLSATDTAREKLKALDVLKRRIGDIEEAIGRFETETKAVSGRCGFSPERPTWTQDSFLSIVDQLAEVLNQAQSDVIRVERLKELVSEASEEVEKLNKAVEDADHDINELFQAADVNDEEEFRRHAEVFRIREELQATIRNHTRGLERIAGTGTALDQFIGELRQSTPEGVKEREERIAEQVESLETDLAEKERHSGDLEGKISQLEQQGMGSELRLNAGVLRQQLGLAVAEWSILTIARKLLGETRTMYERERQPAVIQEAQSFFGRITDGRYRRLLSPPGEGRIEVEDAGGHRVGVSQLSRGTSEQLYLALRFGLIREFGRRSEVLPVAADDVLVNFDPGRARQACRALVELSTSHQVILFTCHPSTADLLRSEASHCKVVELAP